MFSFFKRKKSGGGERKKAGGKGRGGPVSPPNPDRSDMGNDHSQPDSGTSPDSGPPPQSPHLPSTKEQQVDEDNNLPGLSSGTIQHVGGLSKICDDNKCSDGSVLTSRDKFFNSAFNIKENNTLSITTNLRETSGPRSRSDFQQEKPPSNESVTPVECNDLQGNIKQSLPDNLKNFNGYNRQGSSQENNDENVINSKQEIIESEDIKFQEKNSEIDKYAIKPKSECDVSKEKSISLNTYNLTDTSNISVKSDSEYFEECVNRDERPSTNETKEEKSVTDSADDYASGLAKTGALASREEYSSGNSPDGGSTEVIKVSGESMHRLGTCRIEGPPEGLKFREDTHEGFKGVPEGSGETKGVLELFKCEESAGKVESSESSEDEEDSSEGSESDSDNVVKNDSGCWEERDGCLFSSDSLSEGLPPLAKVNSILFHGNRLQREKKRVKWADIDGKTDLTRANTDIFQEVSSSSEEEESEEEEKEQEESSENEESSESGEEEISQKCAQSSSTDGNRGRENTESSSSDESDVNEDEEEDEEETEHISNGPISEFSEVRTKEIDCSVSKDKEENETSETEEENSDEEDTSEEEPVENSPSAIGIDIAEMQRRIADLQKDIDNKSSNIDRLQEELDSACSESEKVRQRFKRLEEDLELYRKTNEELIEKLHTTERIEEEKISRNNSQINEAERRIRALETELESLRADYNKLQINYMKLQADRDMEVQIIQKALEKALTDHEEMEAKYEREFENLRTLNSGREVQMLEDFEWKLREVERNCKKKIQDYETEYEQKNLILANQLAAALADMEQISHLKLCEIELNQLKQTSSEQRKNLRLVNRKLEELQVSEKILQEEVHSLRSSLDKEKAHIVAMQTVHKEEIAEKDRKMKVKMEIQIKQLTQEWEERLRKETYKIKTDLERTFREEKEAAIDLAHKVKNQEISQLKQNWEKKSEEFKQEIEKYKNKIKAIESHHRNDLDNAQTNADRELFDLRRKMDKLDMSYQEKIEKLQEKHESDIGSIKEEYEKRVQQAEASLQMQISNSRTTLELVKQQIQNDTQLKLEKLEYQYQQKLEQQRLEMEKEKGSALEIQGEKHKSALEMLYKEIERTKKQARNEHDNLVKRKNQNQQIQVTQAAPQQKNKTQGSSQSLISSRLDVADVAEEIRTQGKEEVLQQSIEQLTKQLNAGKMEIEKLRQQLEAREARQQMQPPHGQQQQRNNAHQPVANPRRNRKGRSGRN